MPTFEDTLELLRDVPGTARRDLAWLVEVQEHMVGVRARYRLASVAKVGGAHCTDVIVHDLGDKILVYPARADGSARLDAEDDPADVRGLDAARKPTLESHAFALRSLGYELVVP